MEMKAKIRGEKNQEEWGRGELSLTFLWKTATWGVRHGGRRRERRRQTPDFSSPVKRTGRARHPQRAVLEQASGRTRSRPGGQGEMGTGCHPQPLAQPNVPPSQCRGCQRRKTRRPCPHSPPLLWQDAYLLWLGLKGPVPMTGWCGPGRFIQRRRDWQAALPETPHITHFTRGEKNLTVWPTFLEQTTRQTTPAAFPKQPQPQPWGSETLVWEELQLQAAVANPGQSRVAPHEHHAQKPGVKRKDESTLTCSEANGPSVSCWPCEPHSRDGP